MADDFYPQTTIDEAEQLMMDVARRIQLTRTQHDEATRNYNSLAKLVNESSDLGGAVLEIYPSGSFAIGAPILGQVKANQHDVDAVLELDIDPDSDPKDVLTRLERAVRRGPGSRYYALARRNSRCVTVKYEDGRTVDLMPVARLLDLPDRVAHLFHWNEETGDSYHKEVNPHAFSKHFLARVKTSAIFEGAFARGRLIVEGETQPLPTQIPLDQKAPRIVALQLIKRARDVAYRRHEYSGLRKPPSVVLAALSLHAPPSGDSLITEVINVATVIRDEILIAGSAQKTLFVVNPAWTPDVFTDRWPGELRLQRMFARDLDVLINDLGKLRDHDLSPDEQVAILKKHFGETAAIYAVDRLAESYGSQRSAGRTQVTSTGRVGLLSAGTPSLPKRTNYGSDPD